MPIQLLQKIQSMKQQPNQHDNLNNKPTQTLNQLPIYKELEDADKIFQPYVSQQDNYYQLYLREDHPLGEMERCGKGNCTKKVEFKYFKQFGKLYMRCPKWHTNELLAQHDLKDTICITIDNEEKLLNLNTVKYCDFSDSSVAEIFYLLCKDKFIYFQRDEKDYFYSFHPDLHIWEPEAKNTLRGYIKQYIKQPFIVAQQQLEKEIAELESELMEVIPKKGKVSPEVKKALEDFDEESQKVKMMKKTLSQYKKNIELLGNANKQKSILECLKTQHKGFLNDDFINIIDTQKHILPVRNGNINLKTGKLEKREKQDYITKYIDFFYQDKKFSIMSDINEKDVALKNWNRYFQNIFELEDKNDFKQEIDYIQKLLGYCITGETIEKVFMVFHGANGDNGKSTTLTLLKKALGSFVGTVDRRALVYKKVKPNYDSTMVKASKYRLAYLEEFEDGEKLDNAQIKTVVSPNATLSMRDLYEKERDIELKTKFILIMNGIPEFQVYDEATLARLRLIPFDVSFRSKGHDKYVEGAPNQKEPDYELLNELEKNCKSVIYWLVEGAVRYYRDGLKNTPPRFIDYQRDFKQDSDSLVSWIKSKCDTTDNTFKSPSGTLYDNYRFYCEEAGIEYVNKSTFGKRMTKLGHKRGGNGNSYRLGIKLNDECLLEDD